MRVVLQVCLGVTATQMGGSMLLEITEFGGVLQKSILITPGTSIWVTTQVMLVEAPTESKEGCLFVALEIVLHWVYLQLFHQLQQQQVLQLPQLLVEETLQVMEEALLLQEEYVGVQVKILLLLTLKLLMLEQQVLLLVV